MFKRKKKVVFIIEGYGWEKDVSYPMEIEEMVFSNYHKAYKKLLQIEKDILNWENKDDVNTTFIHQEDGLYKSIITLEVVYKNGNVYNYSILKRYIN